MNLHLFEKKVKFDDHNELVSYESSNSNRNHLYNVYNRVREMADGRQLHPSPELPEDLGVVTFMVQFPLKVPPFFGFFWLIYDFRSEQ